VVGFALLAVSGVLLALGMPANDFWWLLPGLVVYGVGLAVVLTVNDPVSLDTVPERDHGQASGVSATAEQGGGAVGIALLYALLHLTYLSSLAGGIADRGLPPLTPERGVELRDALAAAQQTGLVPGTFDPRVAEYLLVARDASDQGYVVAFLAVTVLSVIGVVTSAWLVRRPPAPDAETAQAEVPESAWGAASDQSAEDLLGADAPSGPPDSPGRHPVRPTRLPGARRRASRASG
jgi:MFS family permease